MSPPPPEIHGPTLSGAAASEAQPVVAYGPEWMLLIFQDNLKMQNFFFFTLQNLQNFQYWQLLFFSNSAWVYKNSAAGPGCVCHFAPSGGVLLKTLVSGWW